MEPGLSASKVFVRLRPKVYGTGCGHDQEEEGVATSIGPITDRSVALNTRLLFSNTSNVYTFATRVFDSDMEKVEIYSTVLPHLCERFMTEDVLFLAYGQIGTGKTHTIFGEEGTLRVQEPRDGVSCLGLCFTCLKSCGPRPFVLAISAIEFYVGSGVFDLLQ